MFTTIPELEVDTDWVPRVLIKHRLRRMLFVTWMIFNIVCPTILLVASDVYRTSPDTANVSVGLFMAGMGLEALLNFMNVGFLAVVYVVFRQVVGLKLHFIRSHSNLHASPDFHLMMMTFEKVCSSLCPPSSNPANFV